MGSTLDSASKLRYPVARLSPMSEPESPVLRLIPYLAAITVSGLRRTAPWSAPGSPTCSSRLVVAAVAYFGAYFIVKLIIHVLVTRIDSGSNDDHG
jgi:hypothetical protein